jgi:hypothetical protein
VAGSEIIILFAKSRDSAREALRELKRLQREGWIELTCHALIDEEENGALHISETSEKAETIGLAAAEGLSRVFTDHLFQAAGAPFVSTEYRLQQGGCVLAVMADPRYAECAAGELETRGPTVRTLLQSVETELVLRASIEGIKHNIAWLEELVDHEAGKAGWTSAADKDTRESAVRAGRTELSAERWLLQSRLTALRAELEARLVELTGAAEQESGEVALSLARSIMEAERDIADINEYLVLSILDQLNGFATYAAELREKSIRASLDAAVAGEDELHQLEIRMREYRARLTATLASSGYVTRRCAERLRLNNRLEERGLECALQAHAEKMEQRYALLKADIQRLHTDDPRTWNEVASGFRQAWLGVRESINQGIR